MAKTLPAITITDAQFARIAAVMPGATSAEKITNYTAMVKDMLRRLAIEADIRAAEAAAQKAVEDARAAAVTHVDNP